MKATLGVLLFFLMAHGAFAQNSPIRGYSQKILLKNWALSRCLAQVLPEGSAKDDANATAGGYLEFGNQPIEAYEDLSKLVDKYVALHYAGSVKSDFNTMKCIDLFHSKELEEAVTRLSNTKH
jgi:hypothetical protein